MKNIVELYWIVDEIVKRTKKEIRQRGRKNTLTTSEIITIVLIGHFDNMNTDIKLYEYITDHLKTEFPRMPSYAQFTRGIAKISRYMDPFIDLLCKMNFSSDSDLYIVDSSALPVNGYDEWSAPKWARAR